MKLKVPISFCWDRYLWLSRIGMRSDELRTARVLQEYQHSSPPPLSDIWTTLFHQLPFMEIGSIQKIYCLNSTMLLDASLLTIQYYIKHQYWSSLDFYEIDTFGWGHEEVFDTPSLKTYAIFKKDAGILLILASLHKQQYNFITSYQLKKLSLWRCKGRQLVYDSGTGFLAI